MLIFIGTDSYFLSLATHHSLVNDMVAVHLALLRRLSASTLKGVLQVLRVSK